MERDPGIPLPSFQNKLLGRSLLLFLFSLSATLDAQTVRSECNGVWDAQEVWGGTLPTNGDTIVVRHKVKNLDPLQLDQNHVRIEEKGALCGYHPLEIPSGSSLHNHGFLGLSSMDLKDSLINFGKLVSDSSISITGYFHNAGGVTEVGTYSCFDKPNCTPAIVRYSSDSIEANTKGPAYQWTLDGSPLSDSTRHIPLQGSGTYRVRILHDSTDTTAYSPPYTYDPSSVDEPDEQTKKASIRPNPNDGDLRLKLPGTHRYQRLTVFGPQGRELMSRAIDDEQARIDLGSPPSGLYFIRLERKERGAEIRKFVVE